MNWITLMNALLLAVLGIVIRHGKASWLIAGYNTLSTEEKEKYDQKALCKFISNLLFFGAVIMAVEARAQYLNYMPVVVTGFVLVAGMPIVAAIYANTGNRFKKK